MSIWWKSRSYPNERLVVSVVVSKHPAARSSGELICSGLLHTVLYHMRPSCNCCP